MSLKTHEKQVRILGGTWPFLRRIAARLPRPFFLLGILRVVFALALSAARRVAAAGIRRAARRASPARPTHQAGLWAGTRMHKNAQRQTRRAAETLPLPSTQAASSLGEDARTEAAATAFRNAKQFIRESNSGVKEEERAGDRGTSSAAMDLRRTKMRLRGGRM